MRGVFEKMGAELHWDPALHQVTAHRAAHEVVLIMGQNTAEVDGAQLPLDQPAMTVLGRTMVVAPGGRASVQAGAGIVVDSDPAMEDLECRNKAAALLAAVPVARRMAAARRPTTPSLGEL